MRRFIALALPLLLATLVRGHAQPYAISDAPTPLGIRLVHYEMPGEKDQRLAFFWRDASAYADPARAALLTLAPNLMVAGGSATLDGGALDEELKDLGAGLALRRTPTATLGEVFAIAGRFGEAAALLADVLAEPRLPQRTLTREKNALIAAQRPSDSQPQRIATRIALMRMADPHPLLRLAFLDDAEAIAAITTADVDAWRRQALGRDNLVVVVAGPLRREAVVAEVDRIFARLPAHAPASTPPPLTPRHMPLTIAVRRPVEQSLIVMTAPTGWSAGAEGPARALAMAALGGAQNSRLWVALRERLAATYSAWAWIQPLHGPHYRLMLQSSVAHPSVAEALVAMRGEYHRFVSDGVTPAEVEPLKQRQITAHAEQMRNPGAAAGLIRADLLAERPADEASRYADSVRALDAEAVNALIRKHLPAELLTIVVTPVPEAVGADCIITDLAELARCGE